MEPKEVAELQAEKAFEGFIKYSKAAVYWILAILSFWPGQILALMARAVNIMAKYTPL